MSQFRRRMMQKFYAMGNLGYVTNGLVFQLDGINKGSTGNSWTDLIGGAVFTNNNATELVNGWSFSGVNTCYLQSDDVTYLSANENYTVEMCIYPTSNGTGALFIPRSGTTTYYPLFYNNGGNICFLQSGYLYNYTLNNAPYTISLNLSSGLVNGELQTITSTTDYWNNTSYGRIGARNHNTGNPYSGIIYAIRIYNRKLTTSEMLQNQKVDNERFGLGLNI